MSRTSKPRPRREYGTGTLRVRGASWYASWYSLDGRRVQRKVGPARGPGTSEGLTKAQAEAELRRLRDAERVTKPAGRVTMKDAGAELSRVLEVRGRKRSHRMTVAADIRNHLVPFFEEKPLWKIEARDIERYIALKRKTHALKSIRNHLNTMHSIFEIAIRRGWCERNPVKLAERPVIRTTATRIQFLDQDQLEQLLASQYPDDAFGRIERPLYLTAAMTGLRQGELLGLRWRDVDFDAKRIRVVSPYVRGEFGDPKTSGSARSVPMAERVADELQLLRQRSAYSADGDLVFCHPESGHPLDRSKLVRRFKAALDRAELPRITFHELRHTFGTRMAAAGVPLRTIQHWLGHSDARTTQIYAHYQPSEHEVDLVDRAFR